MRHLSKPPHISQQTYTELMSCCWHPFRKERPSFTMLQQRIKVRGTIFRGPPRQLPGHTQNNDAGAAESSDTLSMSSRAPGRSSSGQTPTDFSDLKMSSTSNSSSSGGSSGLASVPQGGAPQLLPPWGQDFRGHAPGLHVGGSGGGVPSGGCRGEVRQPARHSLPASRLGPFLRPSASKDDSLASTKPPTPPASTTSGLWLPDGLVFGGSGGISAQTPPPQPHARQYLSSWRLRGGGGGAQQPLPTTTKAKATFATAATNAESAKASSPPGPDHDPATGLPVGSAGTRDVPSPGLRFNPITGDPMVPHRVSSSTQAPLAGDVNKRGRRELGDRGGHKDTTL